jgi:phosphoribosyl-dephospho-CoA transferase
MQRSGINNPQVRDLVQIDRDSIVDVSVPSCVKKILATCPWAVVHRAHAPAGEIAVGFRGNTRSERWGGFLKKNFICKLIRPSELLDVGRFPTLIAPTPAINMLREVVERWRDLSFQWGPTGSVGFELASGRHVTTEVSDLDIAIRAPSRMTPERARALWQRLSGLQTNVDILVETPECGFSLREYATMSPARILLRCPDGVRLGNDPWRNDQWKNNLKLSHPLVMTS